VPDTGIVFLNSLDDLQELRRFAKQGAKVICVELVADSAIDEVAESVASGRTYLLEVARKSISPVSPFFIVFGQEISERSQSICDNFGIPVFNGFDVVGIKKQMETLIGMATPPANADDPSRPSGAILSSSSAPVGVHLLRPGDPDESPLGAEELASAEEYEQVLRALQPEGQNWRDLEY
jgi:hypothetical protein